MGIGYQKVWFQNQRAKVKKIQKKTRQDTKSTASETESLGESSHESETKIKMDIESEYYYYYHTCVHHIIPIFRLYVYVLGDSDQFMNMQSDFEQKFVPKTEVTDDDDCLRKAFNFCANMQNGKGK